MKEMLQLDNPIHVNSKRERQKALNALAEAKKLKREVTYLPKGYSFSYEKEKTERLKKKLNL